MTTDPKFFETAKVGERVQHPYGDVGTVTEVVRQRFTDDLLRVHWDSDTEGEDRDLYSWASLSREVTA